MVTEAYMIVNSDLDGDYPQFTVTFVSVGGPVACVEWQREYYDIMNPNATSTLIDPVEGVYVNTLTVTEVAGGYYTCVLNNNQPYYQYVECKYCSTSTVQLPVPLKKFPLALVART